MFAPHDPVIAKVFDRVRRFCARTDNDIAAIVHDPEATRLNIPVKRIVAVKGIDGFRIEFWLRYQIHAADRPVSGVQDQLEIRLLDGEDCEKRSQQRRAEQQRQGSSKMSEKLLLHLSVPPVTVNVTQFIIKPFGKYL